MKPAKKKGFPPKKGKVPPMPMIPVKGAAAPPMPTQGPPMGYKKGGAVKKGCK